MEYVVIVELNNSKFYVGRGRDITTTIDRLRGLSDMTPPRWVMMHGFKRVLKVIPCESHTETAEKVTLKLMDKYGIENVRGSRWTNPELTVNSSKSPKQTKRKRKVKMPQPILTQDEAEAFQSIIEKNAISRVSMNLVPRQPVAIQ